MASSEWFPTPIVIKVTRDRCKSSAMQVPRSTCCLLLPCKTSCLPHHQQSCILALCQLPLPPIMPCSPMW
jgi:hypothetical protein